MYVDLIVIVWKTLVCNFKDLLKTAFAIYFVKYANKAYVYLYLLNVAVERTGR